MMVSFSAMGESAEAAHPRERRPGGPHGRRAGRSDAPGQWTLLALAFLALLMGAREGRASDEEPALETVLYGTVLDSIGQPGFTDRIGVPEDLRSRLDDLSHRAEIFRSRFSVPSPPPGPEAYTMEKRRRLERDLVLLTDAGGIEEAAASYAAKATIVYEWEGMSDGPLAEAAYADSFMRARPGSRFGPYLNLFIAHRLRCALETLAGERHSVRRDSVEKQYGRFLGAALQDPDPLIRFVAADIERRPYLYLPGSARDASSPEVMGLSLRDALDLADAYVRKAGIDLSQQRLRAVVLLYDAEAGAPYWHLQWSWSQPKLGGEFGLRVYLDGRVVEARLGP